MGPLKRFAQIVAVALIVACAGPTATSRPSIPQPTGTAVPTQSPTSAGPTQTAPLTSPAPTAVPPTSESTPNVLPPTEPPPSQSSAPTTSTPTAPVAWRELSAGAGPSAREDHSWTVDGDGAVAYLFGGRGTGGASDELWAFDLGTSAWSRVQIAAGQPEPAARFGHTATWVPGLGLVIWSGQAGSDFFGDIWAFSPESSTWTELPGLGAVPDARYGSCASLGPDGELWVSHGFTNSGRFSDTRSYNFETGTWTDRTPQGEAPVKRCLHDCFWASDGRLVLYAGQTDGRPALGDLWAYDAATGAWSEAAAPSAPARQLYALATRAGHAIVFGGASVEGDYLSDAWRLDSATLDLAPIDGLASEPSGRAGATLVTDEPRNRVLLFGGRNSAGTLADMWEMTLP